ncbi:MAG: hypothetical protein ACT4PU_00380 [Planctomycetota bacterium]
MSGQRVLRVVLATALVWIAAIGCSAPPKSCEDIESRMDNAVRRSKVLSEQSGQMPEAWQLYRAVDALDPQHPGVADLRAKLGPAHEDLFERPMLGSNFRQRPQADRWFISKVLWYLPDRVLDILDVFSFDVHFGLGAFVNVHLTRFFQGGAGFRSVGGIGWHRHRSLGLMAQAEAGIVFPVAGTQAYGGSIIGTSGIIVGSDSLAGMHRPSAEFYQEYRDYWAIGAAVTAAIVGVDFDFHPVQLADALVGFAAVDFLNDDFAHTRGLNLNSSDRLLVRELREFWAVEEDRARYTNWVARGRPPGE